MGYVMEIMDRIKALIEEIRTTAYDFGSNLLVAFSGGMDSTAVALLCGEAIGKENVELVNVVYGPYTYSNSLEIVSDFAEEFGFRLAFVHNHQQEQIWKYGPSCNMCTRQVKMGSVLEYANGKLVVTGSNSSDTWGQTGLKLFNGMYAPLGDIGKEEVQAILDFYEVRIRRIGEHALREGCKLKHLLKPMTNPNYHGRATAIANEMILDYFPSGNEIANVKITGPLSRNVAIINVKPFKEKVYALAEELKRIDVIDEVIVADKPLILDIVANPSIYRVKNSRFWIEEGRLKPEFAVPIKVEWHESRNNKLRTFHVVEVREWTTYEIERDKYSENCKKDLDTNSKTICSCSMPSVIPLMHMS